MADTTVGFDVDGIATSCDSLNRFDPSSATCAVRIGAVTGNEAICDTTTPSATCGVDNAFNRLRKKSNGVYGSEALPQLFEFNAGDDICQRATALVTVEGFNGLANDPEVSVTLDVSMRLTAPPSSDGGTSIALDASSSAPDGGLPACRVAADGTFSVESFEWSPSQVSQVKLTGYVSQSQLVVDLGAEGAVPFPTRLGVVTFRGGYLVGQLQYNNMPLSTQIPLTPTMARSSSFRMVDGTLGSTLALDTTVGLARYLGGAGLALVSLCESADMPFPPVPRGSTTKESCNGLSTVLRLGYTSVNSNPAVSAEKRPTIYTAPPIANACSFQF
jgi:hypothetical protein